MRDVHPNRAEFSRLVIVDSLSPGWTVMKITADTDERITLARRFKLVALERLEVEVYLGLMADSTVRVRGSFRADVVQICVVTLVQITVTMVENFALTYRLSPESPSGPSLPPGER